MRRTWKSASLCFIVTAVVLVQQTGFSAESDDPQEMLEYLVNGLKNDRQRLRRGIFRIHGERIREDPPPVGKLEGPVQMLGAFDFEQGCYRFDRQGPSWKVIGKESDVLDRKMCHTSELSIHYNNRYSRIEIHPPDTVNPSTLVDTEGYLNVRCVGVYAFGQLFKSLELEPMCQQLLETPGIESCVEEGDGVYRVDWMVSERKHISRWIDTKRGFTPIRMESRYRLPELGETQWRAPFQTHEIKWTQIADVWVPASYQIFYRMELPPEKDPEPPDYKYTPRYRTFHCEYAFEWESVNEPVDEAYFNYEGFDLPDGTKIADARAGELRVLGVIGTRDRAVAERDLSNPLKSTTTSRRVPTLLIINGLALIIGAVVWWRVRRRRAK